MANSYHQTGFIVTRETDGSFSCTTTSIAAGLTADGLQELLASFDLAGFRSQEQIEAAIAADGHAVIGSPTRLIADEESLCIC